MNFGTMLAALYDDLTYQETPAATITTRLKRWINEAHGHALRLSGLVGLRQGTIPFLSRQGQATYGLPQVFERIDAIVEDQNDRRLAYRSRDWYRSLDPGERSEGTPTVWIDEGLVPVQRQPLGSGVWAVSDNAADVTPIVTIQGVRANGDIQVSASATLTGTTPVQIGTIIDYVTILKWELNKPALGTVTLLGIGFPNYPLLDDFNRADENPLSFAGQWLSGEIDPELGAPAPLALFDMMAGCSTPTVNCGSYWSVRLQADFQVYMTVPVLPAVALVPGSWNGVALIVLVEQPNITSFLDFHGFHCQLTRNAADPANIHLQLLHREPPASYRVIADTVVTFEAGDAFGMQRQGSTFILYVRHGGAWAPVATATDSAFHVPMYLAPGIADSSGSILGGARIDDVGAGPLDTTGPTTFPTQPLFDDFNRADENPLSFGGNWLSDQGGTAPPLALIGNQVGPSDITHNCGSFWRTRLAPNFQVYATVAVLPGLAVSDWVGAGLIVFIDQPDSSITSPNAVRGYHLHFARYPFDPSVVYLQLIHRAPGPAYTVIASARLETFVAGDAIGMARQGSQFTLYMRHAGVWVQVAQAFHTDFYGPVWLAPGIADWTSATPGITRLDDIGGGPIEGTPQPPIGPPPGLIETGRILARMPIGRSHVQYQGIRLWPTPSADLTYRVDGQFLIPELVTPTDVPMLPESYHDMLVCYARWRQYKFNGDETRAMLEFQEWTRWLGNLQAYVEYPPDYRPVMGVLTEDGIRWTNLPGGYFPADGWGR